MTNIYSRLYTYRQNGKRDPLEVFPTEALADLFDRLDATTKRALLAVLLPSDTLAQLESFAPDIDALNIHTQVVIGVEDHAKRPAMVLRAGRRNLVVIEVKVGTGFQSHAFTTLAETNSEPIVQNQLETYAEWIGYQ